jgi:hypothetical protein
MTDVVVEIRCAKCRRVLRSVTDDEVPADWSGRVHWMRCRKCDIPAPSQWFEAMDAMDSDTFSIGGSLPWSQVRRDVGKARVTRRKQTVYVRVARPT